MTFDALQLWLTRYPDWILGCIFVVSFFESLAMVGILSPGIALLFVAGTAAGGADIAYWQVLLAAYAGAVLGDVLSYGLGAHFHKHMVAIPPFKQHPEWIDKAEAFFNRYGLYGLFVGRFIGPLRPVLPMIAGALELPFLRFLMLDLCSGPLWAAAYLTPGYLVGSAAGAPPGEIRQLAFFIAGLLGLTFIVAELLWRLFKQPRMAAQAANTSLAIMAIASLILIALFGIVLGGTAAPLNQWLAISIANLRQPEVDIFFVALTGMGDMRPMVIWALVVAAVLLVQKAWWPAAVWGIGTLMGNALMQVMKSGIAIERPHLSQRVTDGYSFPSGHASMGLVFMGLLAMLAWGRLSHSFRRIVVHITAVYVALMSASRLYLGVHWSSDILAGWALATVVITACRLMLQAPPAILRNSTQRVYPLSLGIATIAVWLTLGISYLYPALAEALQHYAPALESVPPQ